MRLIRHSMILRQKNRVSGVPRVDSAFIRLQEVANVIMYSGKRYCRGALLKREHKSHFEGKWLFDP